MLQVSSLNTWHGPAQILFDISFDVQAGEVVTILGRDGAGKSTTFRSLMGILPKRSGRVFLNEEDISALPSYEIARRGLGYVPEDRRIFTDLTVEENLKIGRQSPRKNSSLQWSEEKIYRLFPKLATMRKRLGNQMSGGEQQMLSIARTLMGNPTIILLDEPSEGLAPKIIMQMADAILEMKQEGLSVLLSEKNFYFAQAISDRYYMIDKGRMHSLRHRAFG